jgi:type II secretory pathway component PulC
MFLVATSVGCATAPREAAPLNIKRVPPKRHAQPLIIKKRFLYDVLNRGPGRFFERMPVTPHRMQGRFVGFQIMQLYGRAAPNPDGIHVGDVVTAVNGISIRKPDHFMRVWDGLKKARTISIDLIRNSRPRRVTYRIVD